MFCIFIFFHIRPISKVLRIDTSPFRLSPIGIQVLIKRSIIYIAQFWFFGLSNNFCLISTFYATVYLQTKMAKIIVCSVDNHGMEMIYEKLLFKYTSLHFQSTDCKNKGEKKEFFAFLYGKNDFSVGPVFDVYANIVTPLPNSDITINSTTMSHGLITFVF